MYSAVSGRVASQIRAVGPKVSTKGAATGACFAAGAPRARFPELELDVNNIQPLTHTELLGERNEVLRRASSEAPLIAWRHT